MIQRKKWEVDFLGVLPTKEEVFEILGRHKSVFINSQNYLQFFLKILNETPENFPRDQLLFTCYSTELEKYGFEENFHEHEITRFNELGDFLYDSLVLFKPIKKVLTNHEEVFATSEVRLIPKLDNFKSDQKFKSVPIFSKSLHKMNKEEFIESLIQGKYIGSVQGISTDQYDTPSFVLWKEGDEFTAYGLFDKHEYAHGGLSLSSFNNIRELPFNPWKNNVYREGNDDDSLLFVDLDSYSDIEEKLKDTEPFNIGKDLFESSINVGPNEGDPSIGVPEEQNDTVINIEEDVLEKEEEFMEHFIQVTREMGLVYNEKDLYNFHTAMKSNSLTILAGMSGTGKSRLVQAYGRALGLDTNQLIFIPVRPSWNDDSDLLGYVDTKNMLYRPSDTYLVDTLFYAQQERNKLFIICFDEMNLSRVEHYFSQFLSVLEMDINRRILRLYSDRIAQQIYNSAQYSPEINIGSNVIFVGTVNLDESTYHFSDKVLDRANVISLKVQPYTMLKNTTLSRELKEKTRKPFLFDQYNKFKKQDLSFALTNEELDFLWALHKILSFESKNQGIGPRVIKQIDNYLKNLPPNKYLTREDAFDVQIVQRVLTKLRGPEGLLKGLIGKPLENSVEGSLYQLLEDSAYISHFKKTKEVIYQKAKELKVNGFTF